jgi:hypothetical protein
MVGIPASLKTGFGLTMVRMPAILKTGGGDTMVGIAEFTTGCVEGAATAFTADRARAEPRATHETCNHERIWISLNWRTETCSKTN